MSTKTIEFTSSNGDIYRVVAIGKGYGVALYNAHFKAWIDEQSERVLTRKQAIARAKERANT